MPVLSKANIKRAFYYMKRNGLINTYYASKEEILEGRKKPYVPLVPDSEELNRQRLWSKDNSKYSFSVVVPTYRTPERFLKDMVRSVFDQTYSSFQLVIADATEDDSVKKVLDGILEEHRLEVSKGISDGVSKVYDSDDEIDLSDKLVYIHLDDNKGISNNTNEGILAATSDYVGLLDHDDLLTPDALYEMAKAIKEYEDKGLEAPKMLYTDEDKCDETGESFFEPHIKTDFLPDYILSNNYVCHFTVVKRELIQKLLLRKEYDGAQDFDLVLRVWLADDKPIVHIPKVLYHWRCHQASTAGNPQSKLYAYQSGQRAIENACKQMNWPVNVLELPHLGHYALDYQKNPLDFRPELGAIGGRVLRSKSGKTIGGPIDKNGEWMYAGMPAAYTGYYHRVVLTADVCGLDIRNIKLRKELYPIFKEVVGVDYSETLVSVKRLTAGRDDDSKDMMTAKEWESVFDCSLLPKNCDYKALSIKLSKAITEAGYLLMYQPRWIKIWKK